ncbi:MAG: tRNA (adenosine(37)-N6)-dimethylallyltransferase MiaA [Bacteroidales bacterium]|nr:tRNA (adenosine(37)-N6)-dimethylallyltransferase MiaA [Bacteroides sp.]MCM1501507.1 tRNA (adenosine(37)-N6)-dimethylallyltransferase MiaA [Bacteroidales bacterium]
MGKKLIIILGPTAVGKTDYSIETAQKYGSPVISCDSRQVYREMEIGTAVPSASQLAAVKHYFIQSHTVTELYTAGRYELEALSLIDELFRKGHDTLVMAGGSGFYIDAVCNGLDDFPPADLGLREELTARLRTEGVESLRLDLKRLDPESYATIDIANGQRVVRALEVCLMTGRPFSSFKTSKRKQRGFEIEKIGLTRQRNTLYGRIDRRVVQMIDDGLVDEVRSLLPYRGLAALQTVGYKEIFQWLDYLDGRAGLSGMPCNVPNPEMLTTPAPWTDGPVTTLERAVELIQRNTRHYAKRQLSWWNRDKSIRWIEL